jgi:hypothetical protein
MKRSVQEIIELAVFGLIALLVGTGVLWLTGWVLGGLGWLLQLVSGLLWSLLRFVVPVAIAAGLVYLLVRWLQGQGRRKPVAVSAEAVAEPAAETVAQSAVRPEVSAGKAAVFPAPAAETEWNPDDSWHPPAAAEVQAAETAAAPADAGNAGPVSSEAEETSSEAGTETEAGEPAADSREEA